MNTKKKTAGMLADAAQTIAGNATDAFSLQVSNLNLLLGGKTILQDISFRLPEHGMNILIGPSGAGKSTLLRCLNQLHTDWQGEMHIMNHHARRWPGGADALRCQVGLIAQKPAVFPCSIEGNVTFGLRGKERKRPPADLIKQVLKQAALWDEVKDRLNEAAETLSIGQQQRLCIARALALAPAMLLLDEPTASLDPYSKQLIEASLLQLAETMPVLCVTHDIEQARRMGGQAIFMCDGCIIETGPVDTFFTRPKRLETREFLRWATCDCG
ncbi:MAG: ATP-binding cassette domain-containing protein [Mariprofundaceae bacterium]|nr:ATP-binding cassette domain-containing protein [Mariprofundaceae bacterium]